MTKVALLTTFMHMPVTYGLVPVVKNQIAMLKKYHNDLPVGLFMVEGYDSHRDFDLWRDDPDVVLEPHVPFMHLYDYIPGTVKQTHDVDAIGAHVAGYNNNLTNFDKQVDLLVERLEPELTRYDVIITHDIVLQTWFVPHNQACRIIAKRHPELKWIHWLHSGPATPFKKEGVHLTRGSSFPHSVFISPNKAMAPGFAVMYNTALRNIKVVHHIFDPATFFDMHPMSVQLIEAHNLYEPEILIVWPTRIDHPPEKGMPMAVAIAAEMAKLTTVKMLFLNGTSNIYGNAEKNIDTIRAEAERHGLPREDLIFSSEMGPDWKQGVPRLVVRDMFMIGNMFIFPSVSETFSYALAEAAVTKNMLILNENLEVMHELVEDRADWVQHWAEYGGRKTTVNYEAGIEEYYKGRAEELLETFRGYKPLRQSRHVLKAFSMKHIWETEVKPLIED